MILSYQYVAGLIDGDGCIHFDLSTDKLYVSVKVEMTNHEIINILHQQFGGGFGVRTPQNSNHHAVFTWKLRGDPAIVLLVSIYPFLVVKKQQALLAMQFYSLNDNNADTNIDFKRQMHLLNKRGVK